MGAIGACIAVVARAKHFAVGRAWRNPQVVDLVVASNPTSVLGSPHPRVVRHVPPRAATSAGCPRPSRCPSATSRSGGARPGQRPAPRLLRAARSIRPVVLLRASASPAAAKTEITHQVIEAHVVRGIAMPCPGVGAVRAPPGAEVVPGVQAAGHPVPIHALGPSADTTPSPCLVSSAFLGVDEHLVGLAHLVEPFRRSGSSPASGWHSCARWRNAFLMSSVVASLARRGCIDHRRQNGLGHGMHGWWMEAPMIPLGSPCPGPPRRLDVRVYPPRPEADSPSHRPIPVPSSLTP